MRYICAVMKNVTHNNKGVTPTTGNDTRRYALVLLERGVSYSDIENETGIPASTLRVMKNRMKRDKNDALQPVTNVTNSVTADVTMDEIVTTTPESVTQKRFTGWQLEAVYYVTCLTACYGFTAAMPGVIGYAFAVVYGLLSFAAIQMVKDSSIPKTAEYGRNMVYALEVFACVFAHYYTINRALWANLKALPFEVKYLPTGGTWIYNNGIPENGYWSNGETVFYLACTLSVILAVLAIAAIALRLEFTKETFKTI